nr:sulfate transporter CysZ [uncultured Desulfuromonas sp.]
MKSIPFTGVRRFSTGFFSLWHAFRFLGANPSLFKYVAIPFAINLLVFSATLYWGVDLFNGMIGHYVGTQEAWYWQILAVFVKVIAGLLTAVIVFFTFTVVGNLIAAPFNDVLSEKTELILTGNRLDEPFSLKLFMADMWRVLGDELRKMSIFVALMIFLLLFNMIPALGPPVYAVFSVALTLFFLVVEYTGYVFSRKHLGFSDQRRFIKNNFMASVGFGLAVMCMLMIPFVQFVTIPIAVIAATRLCCLDGSGVQLSDS